ncbi:MAG TPA: hypothetical protein VEX38_07935 [Fimbriimonadaceae bacterium]|nr:hypothetical protein [Fimbriimonadaceae bacterium]
MYRRLPGGGLSTVNPRCPREAHRDPRDAPEPLFAIGLTPGLRCPQGHDRHRPVAAVVGHLAHPVTTWGTPAPSARILMTTALRRYPLLDGPFLLPGCRPAFAPAVVARRALVAAAAIGLGALLLGGCTPRIDELHVKPNLSHAALQQGKVALMPAAAAMRQITREELKLVDALMYRAFGEHGHGIRRVAFPVVARALQSDQEHWDTLHKAINFGKVDFGGLYRLSKAVGARYIVFTRVT